MYSHVQKPFAPKRYYSIDRVFRNEAVDRTHLAEFHQIEGIYPYTKEIISLAVQVFTSVSQCFNLAHYDMEHLNKNRPIMS